MDFDFGEFVCDWLILFGIVEFADLSRGVLIIGFISMSIFTLQFILLFIGDCLTLLPKIRLCLVEYKLGSWERPPVISTISKSSHRFISAYHTTQGK